MQISYHSVLTKIQKLQNLKKKKTFFFTGRYTRYRLVLPEIGRYMASTAGIFLVRNMGIICTGLLAGTVYSDDTGRYSTELTRLAQTHYVRILDYLFVLLKQII